MNRQGSLVCHIDKTEAEWRLSSGRWEWDPIDKDEKTIRPFRMDRFFQNLPRAITAGHQIPIFYTHPATTAVTNTLMIMPLSKDDEIEG